MSAGSETDGWRGASVFDNRWDEFDGMVPPQLPEVSVVIVHFEQQAELDRTLSAVARQSYPVDLIEVIVVDDGSAVRPSVPPGVTLIVQPDHGFRLSAARNIGVAASRGSVLCFLDADTSPEPGYVRELTRLPALAPEVVTVGRRRHADFGGVDADDPVEAAGPAHPLADPLWLRREYADSRNLLDVDDRSYRFVIGAVVACSRRMFDDIGGFDEDFDSYGGEDWEWAYRAWLRGAAFAHVPTAIAWHDGPEWAGRDTDDADRAREKNGETLRLVELIPIPGATPYALFGARADIVIEVKADADEPPAAVLACVDSLLREVPRAHVIVSDAHAAQFLSDPRVIGESDAQGPSSSARFDRVRLTIRLSRLVAVSEGSLAAALARFDRESIGYAELSYGGASPIRIEHARSSARSNRWSRTDRVSIRHWPLDGVVELTGSTRLAAYFGGWLG